MSSREGDLERPHSERNMNRNSRREGGGGRNNQNRKNKRHVTRFGDEDFTLSTIDDFDEADWGEVFRSCCIRPPTDWFGAAIGTLILIFFLYFYLYALVLFSAGAKVLSGCRAGDLFSSENLNPVTDVMIGTLATSLVQSSSTTTSIIVTLVRIGTISVANAQYFIMGANIGTTVTNNIASLVYIRNPYELERAFSAAVLHDLINIMSVIILLPFEAATGYLEEVTKLIVEGAETTRGEEWEGPVEKLVYPLVNKLIMANSGAVIQVAAGNTCESFYPTECVSTEVQNANDGSISTFDECSAGFIKCNGDSHECPSFYREGGALEQDQVAGGICVFLALFLMYVCILCITAALQHLVKGFSTRVVFKATNINGYFNIAIGAGLTLLLQSSSLTTSLITPLAGVGILRIEQIFPLTLGANIGTTLTAIMVAKLAPSLNPLHVALIHVFFNITSLLIWYPIPHMRKIPIYAAKRLGYCARVFRFFPVIYIVFVYFILPRFFIALSNLYINPTPGQLAGAIIITLLLAFIIVGIMFWCRYRRGGEKTEAFVERYLSCKRNNGGDVNNIGGGDNDGSDSSNFEDEQNTNNNNSDDDSSTSGY